MANATKQKAKHPKGTIGTFDAFPVIDKWIYQSPITEFYAYDVNDWKYTLHQEFASTIVHHYGLIKKQLGIDVDYKDKTINEFVIAIYDQVQKIYGNYFELQADFQGQITIYYEYPADEFRRIWISELLESYIHRGLRKPKFNFVLENERVYTLAINIVRYMIREVKYAGLNDTANVGWYLEESDTEDFYEMDQRWGISNYNRFTQHLYKRPLSLDWMIKEAKKGLPRKYSYHMRNALKHLKLIEETGLNIHSFEYSCDDDSYIGPEDFHHFTIPNETLSMALDEAYGNSGESYYILPLYLSQTTGDDLRKFSEKSNQFWKSLDSIQISLNTILENEI